MEYVSVSHKYVSKGEWIIISLIKWFRTKPLLTKIRQSTVTIEMFNMFLPFLWFSFSLCIHGKPPLKIRPDPFLWVDPASFFLYLVVHQNPC